MKIYRYLFDPSKSWYQQYQFVEERREETNLFIKNGENVCQVSMWMHIINEGDAIYQTKKLRINACILNGIHILTFEESISIAYLGFAGRNAYLSQIFKINDKHTAHEIGKVVAIKNLLELEVLWETPLNILDGKVV
ncbi:hypothetical protein CU098_005492 [Rhizopus stolonifer]|uniref:Uncharacterized protein n=1 Tax=Rhizopus stolonifer TaxID=4846 RepID=A0A367KPD2_RHIST|nr:hypothetical protein CU098_005492 [Rhizopus stolonifer]